MFRILLFFVIATAIPYAQQNTIPLVAVSDLVNQGLKQSEANVVTEQLRAELHKTGRFRIIERNQMNEILKEQGFQQTGCTTDACAINAGQLLGANKIVVGVIGTAGSYTVLTVRLLDVQTGEVLVDETIRTVGGIDKIIESKVSEIAAKVVLGFSKTISFSLMDAVKNGNLIEVERLIKTGLDVNTRDTDGVTPLHIAAARGHTNIVVFLVKHRANVNLKDNYDATPLHMAAANGRVEVTNILLSVGAELKATDNTGSTPLGTAAFLGRLDIVKLLVNKGSDINVKDKTNSTPLHDATYNGRIDIVNFLLSKGANINAKDINGNTPLIIASDSGGAFLS